MQQFLHFLVGLVPRNLRVEVDEGQLGNADSEGPPELADDDFGTAPFEIAPK